MACTPFVARPITLADALEARGYTMTPEERAARQRVITSGFHGFICGPAAIETCGCGNAADRYCDYPMGNNKTCDVAMCQECGLSLILSGSDYDLCPIHAAEHRARKEREP